MRIAALSPGAAFTFCTMESCRRDTTRSRGMACPMAASRLPPDCTLFGSRPRLGLRPGSSWSWSRDVCR